MILPLQQEKPWLPRSTLLFRALRSAVESSERSAQLSYQRLSELTSTPRSTLCRWLHGESEPSAEAILCLFERLAPDSRAEVLNQVCRTHPTLGRPHVADPATISRLLALLSGHGVTFVRGEEFALVLFLTAAANTLHIRGREVIGLDTHAPTWFSPAPGVLYSESASSLHALLKRVMRARGAIVILNPGPISSELKAPLHKAAQRNQVLLAVAGLKTSPPWSDSPCRLITVSLRGPADALSVCIEEKLDSQNP